MTLLVRRSAARLCVDSPGALLPQSTLCGSSRPAGTSKSFSPFHRLLSIFSKAVKGQVPFLVSFGHWWASFTWHNMCVPIVVSLYALLHHSIVTRASLGSSQVTTVCSIFSGCFTLASSQVGRSLFADLFPCTIWTWTCLLRCRSCRWGFSTTWTKRVAFSGYLGIWFTLNETLLGAGAMVTLPWLRWDSVYGTGWISNRLFAFLQLSICCCYFVGQQKTLCQLLPTGVLSTPLSCLLAIARGRKLNGLRS